MTIIVTIKPRIVQSIKKQKMEQKEMMVDLCHSIWHRIYNTVRQLRKPQRQHCLHLLVCVCVCVTDTSLNCCGSHMCGVNTYSVDGVWLTNEISYSRDINWNYSERSNVAGTMLTWLLSLSILAENHMSHGKNKPHSESLDDSELQPQRSHRLCGCSALLTREIKQKSKRFHDAHVQLK